MLFAKKKSCKLCQSLWFLDQNLGFDLGNQGKSGEVDTSWKKEHW